MSSTVSAWGFCTVLAASESGIVQCFCHQWYHSARHLCISKAVKVGSQCSARLVAQMLIHFGDDGLVFTALCVLLRNVTACQGPCYGARVWW